MVDACWRVFRWLSYPIFWGLSSSMRWESLYRLTNKYHGITQGFQRCSHLLFLPFLNIYWLGPNFAVLEDIAPFLQSSWTQDPALHETKCMSQIQGSCEDAYVIGSFESEVPVPRWEGHQVTKKLVGYTQLYSEK